MPLVNYLQLNAWPLSFTMFILLVQLRCTDTPPRGRNQQMPAFQLILEFDFRGGWGRNKYRRIHW
jgi:hypothetical protein